MDLDDPRVLFVTPGRDGATVKAFAEDLKAHGGYPEAVGQVSCDMSVAFIAGVRDYLSNADITFDRFHIMKNLGEAVDTVRRDEAKDRPLLLKKTRWLWLTNRSKLSESQQRELVWLTRPSLALATTRAHRWREDFQGFYDLPAEQAQAYLTRWCNGAMRSRLQPLKDFVGTVKRHWAGILAWCPRTTSRGRFVYDLMCRTPRTTTPTASPTPTSAGSPPISPVGPTNSEPNTSTNIMNKQAVVDGVAWVTGDVR